jgi:hypothetical protein
MINVYILRESLSFVNYRVDISADLKVGDILPTNYVSICYDRGVKA